MVDGPMRELRSRPPNEATLTSIFQLIGTHKGATRGSMAGRCTRRQLDSQRRPDGRNAGTTRHAGPFSVNKSPDDSVSSATFESVDSCKQKPHSVWLQVAPAMKQSQPQVVQDSKDMTMSAVINRGGGRPSKGLRKYIGFRTQAKTAEDVQMIAAAKGMTVTDYVSSAVDRSLREDLALLDHFAPQEELPIRMAS
jgi:hypothetical protein